MYHKIPTRAEGLEEFSLEYEESKLNVLADRDLRKEAQTELAGRYNKLEDYIQKDPFFLTTYEPLEVDANAPEIVVMMAKASHIAGVGPMAAVAGTFSELIGEFLLENNCTEVMVENGGDIYLKVERERTVGIYAGTSPLSGRFAFKIKAGETPTGVCTSSGTVGHSISLGDSDSVTVVAESCSLADAAATSIGNLVRNTEPLDKGVMKAKSIKGINGAVIIKDENMVLWGKLPEIIEIL